MSNQTCSNAKKAPRLKTPTLGAVGSGGPCHYGDLWGGSWGDKLKDINLKKDGGGNGVLENRKALSQKLHCVTGWNQITH